MQPLDIDALLSMSHVFSGIDRETYSEYFGRPTVTAIPRGRTIFTRGQPAVAFYILTEGWVRLYRSPGAGEPVTIQVFGPGETFAEALIAPGSLYPVSADSLTPVRVVRVDCATYRTMLAVQPRTSLSLIGSTFLHLKRLVDQVESVKGWTLKRRVAEAILRFVPPDETGTSTFDFPFERGLLAQKLGISPATLSRTFPTLDSIGVHVSRNGIVIDDIAKVRDYVAQGRSLKLREP
jgi:CRP/FNR family transcriptional regulator, dissimilatory nitrate respiration regulator